MNFLRKAYSEVVRFVGGLWGIPECLYRPLPDDYEYKPGDMITHL